VLLLQRALVGGDVHITHGGKNHIARAIHLRSLP
jgi:hypothetical protein